MAKGSYGEWKGRVDEQESRFGNFQNTFVPEQSHSSGRSLKDAETRKAAGPHVIKKDSGEENDLSPMRFGI